MEKGIYKNFRERKELEGGIVDISRIKQTENNLRYLNRHYSRSGLYNRSYLEMILEKDSDNENDLKRACIGINLSGVQLLVANYGFHYTENIIEKAADELIKLSTDQRILFQTYENLFVFYMKDYKDKDELINFSDIIGQILKSIFVMDRISGGIGILEIELNYKNKADLLLRRLLIASEKSINIFEKDFKTTFYDEALEDIVNRETEIITELARIAEDNNGYELFVQYQPIIDLKTNLVWGFEALARLRTETLGLVSPSEFIPIAEKTKLINPIGELIIIEAFNFLNRLKKNGYKNIHVSINISAIQLLRPDFVDRLFQLINEMNVNPFNISIEITESILTFEYVSINKIIDKLRSAGIHIAIDDFGTGYSSLGRVNELNVNSLKIDKYFIDRLLDTDLDKTITSDIISMAHKLGHFTIAEGVEYESQLEYLRKHNCDKVQGYLFSRPLYEDMAIDFLKNN